MTRAEAAIAKRKTHNQARREALTQEARALDSQERTLQRKARDRRRYAVGALVEEAGLLWAEDARLATELLAIAQRWQREDELETLVDPGNEGKAR